MHNLPFQLTDFDYLYVFAANNKHFLIKCKGIKIPEVPKWPTGADCKSAGFSLRRFESFPLDTLTSSMYASLQSEFYVEITNDLNKQFNITFDE